VPPKPLSVPNWTMETLDAVGTSNTMYPRALSPGISFTLDGSVGPADTADVYVESTRRHRRRVRGVELLAGGVRDLGTVGRGVAVGSSAGVVDLELDGHVTAPGSRGAEPVRGGGRVDHLGHHDRNLGAQGSGHSATKPAALTV
jgi:hypothetical protein